MTLITKMHHSFSNGGSIVFERVFDYVNNNWSRAYLVKVFWPEYDDRSFALIWSGETHTPDDMEESSLTFFDYAVSQEIAGLEKLMSDVPVLEERVRLIKEFLDVDQQQDKNSDSQAQ